MKILKALDKTVDLLSQWGILLSGILLLAMSVDVTFGVVKRYLFASPSIVAIELLKIFLIPACVLAVPYVQRYDRHLKVDFLFNRFSQKAQQILLQIFVPATGLFVGYVLVWKGWVSMAYSLQIHETSFAIWAEPLWPVRLVIPIGYGLLCLVMLGELCRGVGKLVIGSKKSEPVNPDTNKRV